MAFASPPKTKKKPASNAKKRSGAHHKQTKHYTKHYWPYIPMAIIVGFGFVINVLLGSGNGVLGLRSNLSDSALLRATNQQRVAHNSPVLLIDPSLDAAAQAKAEDMVQRNYWSHRTPDGKAPWVFMSAAGYNYQIAGENLAFGFDQAEPTVKAWMNSSDHRKNILESDYTNVGFGIASSPNFVGRGPETVIVAMYGNQTEQTPTQNSTSTITEGTVQSEEIPSQQISRFGVIATNDAIASAGLILVIGLALGALIGRHAHYLHNVVVRGEYAVIRHPLIDIAVTIVVVAGVLLLQTIGNVK